MEAVTQQIPLEHFLVLSAILFSIGVYGVLTRRNAVLILMSVELMLNAASINMVAFAAYTSPAMMTGITDQQISNDPGGDRWIQLIDRAVDLLSADTDNNTGTHPNPNPESEQE